MGSADTIAAVATGAGNAGIGVVRVSGPLAQNIASKIIGETPLVRHAHYLPFLDANAQALDVGIALLFKAPNSYTGEDVLELQGHGGSVVLDMLLARVIECGARLARPGEFTERAFLNDKMDLAQAEAVADLISSSSASAAQAAVRSMSGEFSQCIHAVQSELTSLRAWLEAALDFSEEEIDFLADPQLSIRASDIVMQFDTLLAKAEQGQRLRDGLTVVIAGITNVGKSSLMNALSGEESAIVTDIAGTTRDVLREDINIDGLPLHIIDTAGLRETDDVVEKEGISRARRAIDSADHVLVMVDAERMQLPELQLPEQIPASLIVNKSDLLVDSGNDKLKTLVSSAVEAVPQFSELKTEQVLTVSAKTGAGMDAMRQHLLNLLGNNAKLEGAFIARRRHLDALQNARASSLAALERLKTKDMPELAAEELRQAQYALDTVTGRFDSEDLLGEIFGSFCIGK